MGEDSRIRVRVVNESVEDAIKKLERYVRRMERRYECPSDVAMQAVKWGRMKETADVCRWLISYQELVHLRGILEEDRSAGTPGKTSKRSS